MQKKSGWGLKPEHSAARRGRNICHVVRDRSEKKRMLRKYPGRLLNGMAGVNPQCVRAEAKPHIVATPSESCLLQMLLEGCLAPSRAVHVIHPQKNREKQLWRAALHPGKSYCQCEVKKTTSHLHCEESPSLRNIASVPPKTVLVVCVCDLPR